MKEQCASIPKQGSKSMLALQTPTGRDILRFPFNKPPFLNGRANNARVLRRLL